MATETLEAPATEKAAVPAIMTRERAIALEEKAEAEHKARIEREVASMTVQPETDEPLPTEAGETKEVKEVKEEKKDEPKADPAESEELADLPRDDKGYVVMRPTRANALFSERGELRSLGATREERAQLKADQARLRAIEAELARFQMEDMKPTNGNGNGNGNGHAVSTDPVKVVQDKIAAAEKAIEEADLEFDKAAEDFATAEVKKPIRAKQRAAIRTLAAAEAELKVLAARGEDSQKQVFNAWENEVEVSKAENKELRDAQFKQDQERFPELKDVNSQHYKLTGAILSHWFKTGDRILTAPDAERLAAETAARSLGIKVLPIEAVKPAQAPPVKDGETAAASAAALRTRGSVIAGASRAAPTTGNVVDVFGKMNQAQRRDFLIKMEAKK